MFDAHEDQASGLRKLFAPRDFALLPLGCATGDAFDRSAAAQLAEVLQRAGLRPMLLDFLADPGLLERNAGADELAALAHRLRKRARQEGEDYDVALVAADPLRLADLTSGLTDTMVVLARGDNDGELARIYAQIKACRLAHGLTRYVAAFRDPLSRRTVAGSHRRLADAAARFLGAAIEFGGVVRFGTNGVAAWDGATDCSTQWVRPMPISVRTMSGGARIN